MSTHGSNNYKETMKILEEDTVLVNKLEYLQIVASRFIPTTNHRDLESEILCHLMPHVNKILLAIFVEAIELDCDESEPISMQTLTVLKEKLQMVINLLQILEDILDFVIKKDKIDLIKVQSIPLYYSQMLYSTFVHCKESEVFYGTYLNSLDEIFTIFEKAQKVHLKLLKLLDFHIVFNFSFEDDLVLFKKILDSLVDLGGVLAEINVKSMSDNWKAYISLTHNHVNVLRTDFDIRRSLLFFTKEIVGNLKLIVNAENNMRLVNDNLKITSFLIKVMLKLCDTFFDSLRNCYNLIWDFLISFYNFSYSQLSFKKLPANVVESIKLQLFKNFDPFLNRLSMDEEFYQVSNFKDRIVSGNHTFGFLITLTNLLQKLLYDREAKSLCKEIDFPYILEILFIAVSKNYIKIMTDDDVYVNLTTTITAFILTNCTRYTSIESTLYKNILAENLWSSLLASDIWCLILSQSSVNCKFELMCNIVQQCDGLLKLNFTHRHELVIIYFIKQLYRMQSHEQKLKFIDKYPVESYIYVWRHIGLEYLPKNCNVKVKDLISTLTEKIEKYDAGISTFNDFIFMCSSMEAVSTVNFEEVYLDVSKLSPLVIRLWDFDSSNEVLVDNNLFKLYLPALCRLTISLSWKWTSMQLVQILQQLKLLVISDTGIKLLVLEFFNRLSNKFLVNTQERSIIISCVSELFNSLLNDGNCVVRQHSLQVFCTFLNNKSHNEIVNNLLNSSKNLQEAVSSFVQKSIKNSTQTSVQLLKHLEEYKFQHVCLQWSSVLPKTKKFKMQDNELVSTIQRMKQDVQNFSTICNRDNLTQDNVSDICYVISQLQQFV